MAGGAAEGVVGGWGEVGGVEVVAADVFEAGLELASRGLGVGSGGAYARMKLMASSVGSRGGEEEEEVGSGVVRWLGGESSRLLEEEEEELLMRKVGALRTSSKVRLMVSSLKGGYVGSMSSNVRGRVGTMVKSNGTVGSGAAAAGRNGSGAAIVCKRLRCSTSIRIESFSFLSASASRWVLVMSSRMRATSISSCLT